jgi:hypothetical protein
MESGLRKERLPILFWVAVKNNSTIWCGVLFRHPGASVDAEYDMGWEMLNRWRAKKTRKKWHNYFPGPSVNGNAGIQFANRTGLYSSSGTPEASGQSNAHAPVLRHLLLDQHLERKRPIRRLEQPVFDGVPDLPHLGELLLGGACRLGRVGERVIPPFGDPGEDRALGFGVVADGDHVRKEFPGLEEFKRAAGFFVRQVDPLLLHHRDHQGVDPFGGLQSRAVDLEMPAGKFSQVGFGDLAAAAVVPADEQNAGISGHGGFPCFGPRHRGG